MMKLVRNLLPRKLAAGLVAGSLIISSIPIGVFGADFSSIQGHWSERTMTRMVNQGILKGLEDGNLAPDMTIPLAQYVTMINRVFGYIETEEIEYSDVTQSAWYYTELQKASAAGYFEGYADGTAGPEEDLTRVTAAVALWRAMGIPAGNASTLRAFTDESEIPEYARGAIAALVERGIIRGFEDNTFRPAGSLTRAQAATIVSYFASNIFAHPGRYRNINEGNVVINSSGVTLSNIAIDGDLYIAEGVGEGTAVVENATVSGDTYVRGGGVGSVHFKNAVTGNMTVRKASPVRVVFWEESYTPEINILSSAIILNKTELAEGSEEDKKIGIGSIIVNGSTEEEATDLVLDGNYEEIKVSSNAELTLANGGTIKALTVAEEKELEIHLGIGALINEITTTEGFILNGVEIEAGKMTLSINRSGNIVVTNERGNVVATVEPKDIKSALGEVEMPKAADPAPTPVPTTPPSATPTPVPTPIPWQTPAPTAPAGEVAITGVTLSNVPQMAVGTTRNISVILVPGNATEALTDVEWEIQGDPAISITPTSTLNATIKAENAGTSTIKVTITTESGKTFTASRVITVTASTTPEPAPTPIPGPSGRSYIFTSTGSTFLRTFVVSMTVPGITTTEEAEKHIVTYNGTSINQPAWNATLRQYVWTAQLLGMTDEARVNEVDALVTVEAIVEEPIPAIASNSMAIVSPLLIPQTILVIRLEGVADTADAEKWLVKHNDIILEWNPSNGSYRATVPAVFTDGEVSTNLNDYPITVSRNR